MKVDPVTGDDAIAVDRGLADAERPSLHVAEFPADWPGPGPIDLAIHDRPHRSSALEWWYVNCHVETRDDKKLSLFAAFFRQAKGRNELTHEVEYAHSVTWAIVDPDEERYDAYSGVDKSAPQMGLERMDHGGGSKDPRINRAMREVLERNHVPSPDRIFDGDVRVETERLDLDYDGNRYIKQSDGSYRLRLHDHKRKAGCDLVFVPQKPPIRHGVDGLMGGVDDELMFYYFIPRCRMSGTVTVAGVTSEVAQGQGWYDHEFGFVRESAEQKQEREALEREILSGKKPEDIRRDGAGARKKSASKQKIAWNWASVQLDDGTDVTVHALYQVDTGAPVSTHAIVCDAQGNREAFDIASFEPRDFWRSNRSFFEYPTRWKLEVPGAGIELSIDAAFRDQEFLTLVSKPAFWEGRMNASGTFDGQPVAGIGFVERSGFNQFDDLDEFFGSVSKAVRKSVSEVLSLAPTPEHLIQLVGSADRERYAEGVDPEQFSRTVMKPLREITDRGGKAWRSYGALACIDVVGGDSRKFVEWLAMPELLHVGSLIVDDVQDKSDIRRGGPACHLIYGEAIAINAGSAAYFIAEYPLMIVDIPPDQKLRLYGLYFEAMRAGHAGQAIDLDGMEDVVPAAVQSGDVRELERRVIAIHRLKTAAPAGSLARMGAVAGGGNQAQVEGVGNFFEAIGLAFQIIDDVLNLRGFKGNLKTRGEDIMQGKITLPVVKAFGILSPPEREWLYQMVKSKPTDGKVVLEVIERLESCGSIEACLRQAKKLVEDAWVRLEPLVEDSLYKVMLRAFSWYVLERHY